MGYTELQFAGVGLIMSDVSIEFKAEAFYGDIIKAEVDVTEISKVAFDIVYKLSKTQDQQDKIIALAKTGMVCYNYKLKKVVAIPEEVKVKLQH